MKKQISAGLFSSVCKAVAKIYLKIFHRHQVRRHLTSEELWKRREAYFEKQQQQQHSEALGSDLGDDMSEKDMLQVAVTMSSETVRNNFITEEKTLSSRRQWRRELSVLLAQSATPATLSPAPCASCCPNRGRSGVMGKILQLRVQAMIGDRVAWQAAPEAAHGVQAAIRTGKPRRAVPEAACGVQVVIGPGQVASAALDITHGVQAEIGTRQFQQVVPDVARRIQVAIGTGQAQQAVPDTTSGVQAMIGNREDDTCSA
ncbi:hypothetical protein QTO34_016943 [Cnephaeus nilssonii]|uniref:Uncharacterized protein n=1 Tax=Cnephaeus nilssonii TaxID=3371016 RepID=A0AA40I3V6_CNENI|nr:hypothetical protein QTO34_016943 [Eptesicus nilssonii]